MKIEVANNSKVRDIVSEYFRHVKYSPYFDDNFK